MKQKPYDAIVFDLGNTIIRFDHTRAARKLAERFILDGKKVYDTFFDSELTRSFEKGAVSPESFHRGVMDLFGIELPFGDFSSLWNDIFWEDDAMCRLARELKPSYPLILFSNINKLHFDYIARRFDIIKIFNEFVLSFEVGAIKPERAMFDEMLRRSGAAKERVLYIDDREDLIAEAVRLGIPAVRHTTAAALREVLAEKSVL